MGKATDMFGTSKLRMPQNLPFKVKIYATDRTSNIDSLMLVLHFKVDYRLKSTQIRFCEMHGVT